MGATESGENRRVGDGFVLLAIVGAAVALRAFTLWIGRPPFTGWLNHTYYYFVQARSLLEQGSLAYPDMPLLFGLYAMLARGLIVLGCESDSAVVAASRIVMCVAPALIAVPFHGIVRRLNRGAPIRTAQWALISIAAFLPLTLLHLPEYLQKNTVGLLGLAVVLWITLGWLQRPSRHLAGVAVATALAIALTHFGTVAALLLWGAALALADAIERRSVRRLLVSTALVAVSGGLLLAVIRALDPQRFGRIFVYLRDSWGESLVAAIFTGAADDLGRVAANLLAIAAYLALLGLLARPALRRAASTSPAVRTFWLSCAICCALLVAPLLDQRLMGRLANFSSVPLLALLMLVEKHSPRSRRWTSLLVGAAAAGVLLLGVGEIVSARVRSTDHDAILAEIEQLGERLRFTERDLVITRTGAEHVCNWFYRVKAGVLPALDESDFGRYERIFVLVPLDGSPELVVSKATRFESAAERYDVMFRNIVPPRSSQPVFVGDHLRLYRLDDPPSEWLFDVDGLWIGVAPAGLS
jgi:hypothetical protein